MVRLAIAGLFLALVTVAVSASDSPGLFAKENLEVLKCEPPNDVFRFTGSNAPSQIFYPGEKVNLRGLFKKGNLSGAVEFGLEIQEISTRDPQARLKEGFTDTAGYAPKLGVEGKPVTHSFKVNFDDKPEAAVEISDVPLPARFGTYALILTHAGKRQFFATACRVPARRDDSNLETTPIFSEFMMFDNPERYDSRAAANARMGIRGLRIETSWAEKQDGTYDWSRLDHIFNTMEKHGLQLMVTLGGHTGWQWPFGPHKQTPAVVAPNWDGSPYWAQADWVCDPKLFPRYGKWITAFCQRYWKDGKGALWGLENYNEPWEGGGISGWARDAQSYRELQKTIANAARSVDPRIKICAASSVMNTEDKLYGDGTREMDKYIDVFTDHYVVPCMCYGPMAAKARGKESVETETWFVNSEYMLAQIVQFVAAGQKRLSPWHPRVLFDTLPGSNDRYFIPAPVVAATAAFNYFLSGKPFVKMPFQSHLPWVFQFGNDDDKNGVLVVLGQLLSIGGDDPKERLWAQVDSASGGTMTIDNSDGLLKFFDLAGNPAYEGQKTVTLPMTIFPSYIVCDKGPAAAVQRLKEAKIEGKRPVEILPRDFATRIDAKNAILNVAVHNCTNREIKGKLAVKAPADVSLASSEQSVTLQAGETRTLTFAVSSAKTNAANSYPFSFDFSSDAGSASYSEAMNAAVVVKGAKTIDGNLDDWNSVPGVTVVATKQKAESTENMRRPWLELKDQQPDGNFAEFKLAWDENYLYIAARVNDKTAEKPSPGMAGRDENAYFHSAASDSREPYKKFLKDFPGRSFAEVPFVYCYSPETPSTDMLPRIHFRRDRLHVALDVSDDWHDLAPTTGTVPYGFHAVPDTDYEYALYGCKGGDSELWRLLAPGVPRRHDFPRTGKPERGTGTVSGARHVVKREGNTYIYEMAIPKEELATLKLSAGTTLGLMLRGGNSEGPHCDYGLDKAAVKVNGLTLHPYWERSANCGVRWTLVD
ncbi:MAG TPA: hypothetical protein VEK08_22070 [Planctomycetota bacterium]|nr:hypothetical protein [Planctomycetota bacterium]